MQRRTLCLSMLAAACGCAAVDPNVVTLSRDELQALVDRAFPRRQRFSDLFDVAVERPSLRLVPERDRIATTLTLTATERIAGHRIGGRTTFEHGLRFEPSDATVRLAQVQVQTLDLEVAGAALPGPVARLGAKVAEQALDDLVLYRLDDARRRRLAAAGLTRARMTVTARGVELRFGSDG